MTTPGSGSPTSWRDVYQLVQDMEKRLTQRMDEIAKAASVTSQDHESRLRVIEAVVQGFQNRERFVSGTLSATQKFILLAIAMLSGAGMIADLIARVTS